MLLYCPPLDIDPSYSAFEVNGHSLERFNTLTIYEVATVVLGQTEVGFR